MAITTHTLLYYLKSIDNLIDNEDTKNKVMSLFYSFYTNDIDDVIPWGAFSCKNCGWNKSSPDCKQIEHNEGMVGSHSTDYYLECSNCKNRSKIVNDYTIPLGRVFYDILTDWNNKNAIN